MRALVFDPASARLPAAALAASLRPTWAIKGPSLLSLRELAEPAVPAPGWLRLRAVRTGICGSDVKEAVLQASSDNPLSGLVSFPHVPGHEIVAQVEEAGDSDLAAGQLVAVDPWLGCAARGLERLCRACQAGFPPHCWCVPDGGPWGTGRGMHLGNVRGLPGGFGEVLFAHPSQCHPIPPATPAELAVLADPMAVALHALERAGEPPAGPVLVVGAGTIGLCLTLAARQRWPGAEVFTTAAWGHQVELVQLLGSTALPTRSRLVVEELARRGLGRMARPWRGDPWLLGGGVEVVLDSIGSADTMELSLRSLAPRGRIVVVGVSRAQRTENTLTYYKEANILGSNGYGRSQCPDDPRHLLELAMGLIATHAERVAAWCTHRFPLSRWREGFAAAADPARSGSIKVTLEMLEEPHP